MALSPAQRIDRLAVRAEELACWRDRDRDEIRHWQVDGRPVGLGESWPRSAGVIEIAAEVEVPADWPLEATWLHLDLGGESLLAFDVDGHRQHWGLDPVHRDFRAPARSFRIHAEAVARLPFGEPVRDPRIAAATLAWRDDAVHDLHQLLLLVCETARHLGAHPAAAHVLRAGEDAVAELDWPSATGDYLARIAGTPLQQAVWARPEAKAAPAPLSARQSARTREVHDRLLARLAGLRQRFPPEGRLAVSGHAHIDLAWLWPYDETRRKLRRSFSTAANLLEERPAFLFNQSTAAYYHQLESDDPALFDRIRDAVARGQWEPVGGMWVETDCVMPAGESLVRQLLYGQRYFERTFGRRHRVAWLPDCFGFGAALPQILAQGGIEYFFTTKMNWSESNLFPHDIFLWEGLDGTRLLAHSFNNPLMSYNGTPDPEVLLKTWANFRGKEHFDESLITIGYGDGGGGPSREMLEQQERLVHFPAMPALRPMRVEDYFDRMRTALNDTELPVWRGEMYLELHRGTLTTQGRIKRLHRQAEQALIAAEAVAGIAALLGAAQPASLEPLWRVLMKTQFHDILPGSSIAEVNRDAEAELAETVSAARAAQDAALDGLVDGLPAGDIDAALVCVNPALDARPLQAEIDGAPLAPEVTLPPMSVTVLDGARLGAAGGLEATPRRLENAHLRMELAADGTIASLFHKGTGREALADRGNQLWAYPMDKPRRWDAWDIENDHLRGGEEITELATASLVEDGPHRAAIRLERRWRDSRIVQTLRLWATSRALEIVTELDWHDRRVLLRSRTPVAVLSEHATYECAFGVVTRPTHRNTSWDAAKFEVPAHRFCDISEPGFGVALLNDGRYGHSVADNVMGLTLLRSPVYPDPMADEGRHRLTYALMPHAGSWIEGGVRESAQALNHPLTPRSVAGLAAVTRQPLAVEGCPVGLAALKPAEDGQGLILRVYEPAGARGPHSVRVDRPWRLAARPLSLLEDAMEAASDLAPFKVRSWRLTRGQAETLCREVRTH